MLNYDFLVTLKKTIVVAKDTEGFEVELKPLNVPTAGRIFMTLDKFESDKFIVGKTYNVKFEEVN